MKAYSSVIETIGKTPLVRLANIEKELELMQEYEPKLYKACVNIFGASYEYTRKYREFQKRKREEKQCFQK